MKRLLLCSERYKNIATSEFFHIKKMLLFFSIDMFVVRMCWFCSPAYDAEYRHHISSERYSVLMAMCIKEENIFRNNFRLSECYIITTMYLCSFKKLRCIINRSTVIHKLYLYRLTIVLFFFAIILSQVAHVYGFIIVSCNILAMLGNETALL